MPLDLTSAVSHLRSKGEVRLAEAIESLQTAVSDIERKLTTLPIPITNDTIGAPKISSDRVEGGLQVVGALRKLFGSGLEAFYVDRAGTIQVYDRQLRTFLPLTIGGLTVTVTTPTFKVIGSDVVYAIVESTGTTGYAIVAVKSNTHQFEWATGGSGTLFTDRFYIYDRDNTAVRLLVDNSGNIIIGGGVVYTPTCLLDVRGETRVGDGTNYLKIASNGTLSLVGTARTWDDLRIEPVARTTGANAPSFEKWFDDVGLAIVTAGGTSRGTYLYSFDDAVAGSEKEVMFTMQMPHAWAGTAIKMHVHWVGSHADTTAAPRWGLEYNWKDIGETYGATTTIYSTGTNIIEGGTDPDVTAGRMYISAFASITPGATADGISSILTGRIFRNSSDAADTYNVASNKCGLLYIDAHYEIDTLGSEDEYVK